MEGNIDKILVGKILENIPDKINPVDYLMDVLALSRDSVYRRLNGKKSFTYHEIAKLSSLLDFSVDEILYIKNNIFTEDFINSSETSIEMSIYLMLKHFQNLAENYISALNDKEMIMSANRLPDVLMYGHKELFRFTCYRWMHLMRELPLDYLFKDFELPNNIISACYDLGQYKDVLKNGSVIFDKNMYLNLIRDIQYFYKRKLISKEELLPLKENLISIIDWGKNVMLYEHLYRGGSFYLSSLNIMATTMYSKYNDVEETAIWSFLPNPTYINNKIACATHRKWLYSLRRYSALVSGANENLLYDFYNKQYEYVENIENISYL